MGNLKQLMYFDASKNRIEAVPAEIEGCVSLSDLHLSTNMLKELPETIGKWTCQMEELEMWERPENSPCL